MSGVVGAVEGVIFCDEGGKCRLKTYLKCAAAIAALASGGLVVVSQVASKGGVVLPVDHVVIIAADGVAVVTCVCVCVCLLQVCPMSRWCGVALRRGEGSLSSGR